VLIVLFAAVLFAAGNALFERRDLGLKTD
jgi:hypothetical protein